MTTVAFDGRFIAADTMADHSGLKMPVCKIYRTENIVLAGAGMHHQIAAYFRKVKDLDLATILSLGYPDYDAEKNYPGMILIGRGNPTLAYYLGADTWMKMGRKYHSVGSGRDFALAAMALGKTAHEAVELASTFDVYTGGSVDCFEV